MLDARLLPYVKRALLPAARLAVSRGLGADQISLIGFGLGVMAFAAICFGQFGLGLMLILANRLCDGLDGEVARATMPSDRGAFLDIALDFVFYALIPLGFAIANPAANALPAAVLLAAFVGTGSSFLAFSVIAERLGLRAEDYPSKGIYYLGGLTEGAETILFLILICLVPTWFGPLAYIFAAACAVTTVSRWLAGWHLFHHHQAPRRF